MAGDGVIFIKQTYPLYFKGKLGKSKKAETHKNKKKLKKGRTDKYKHVFAILKICKSFGPPL